MVSNQINVKMMSIEHTSLLQRKCLVFWLIRCVNGKLFVKIGLLPVSSINWPSLTNNRYNRFPKLFQFILINIIELKTYGTYDFLKICIQKRFCFSFATFYFSSVTLARSHSKKRDCVIFLVNWIGIFRAVWSIVHFVLLLFELLFPLLVLFSHWHFYDKSPIALMTLK